MITEKVKNRSGRNGPVNNAKGIKLIKTDRAIISFSSNDFFNKLNEKPF